MPLIFAVVASSLQARDMADQGQVGSSSFDPSDDFPQGHDYSLAGTGFAELHSHMFTEFAFGGRWLHGNAAEPNKDIALRKCNGGMVPNRFRNHGAFKSTIIPGQLAAVFTGNKGLALHPFHRYGKSKLARKDHKSYSDWPHHNDTAHQQMWMGHVRQAFDNGMKLMVLSAVASKFLCEQTPPLMRRFSCDEKEQVVLQLEAANAFALANSSWVGIARTPTEARVLASQNKLVLVLAVEMSHLGEQVSFNSDNAWIKSNWQQDYEDYRALGARSFQVTHHSNNHFGGFAPLKAMITAGTAAEIGTLGVYQSTVNNVECGGSPCTQAGTQNVQGLKPLGENFLNMLMDNGDVIDFAHMGRRTQADAATVLQANGNYPIFYSHTYMHDVVRPEFRDEKTLTDQEAARIVASEGIVGIRTGRKLSASLATVNQPFNKKEEKKCASTESFYVNVKEAVDNGLSVGTGMDANGFIDHLAPRCNSNNAGLPVDHKRYLEKGLAHIGLLPQVIKDMEHLNVANQYLNKLNNSAEDFIVVWEKAFDIAGLTPTPTIPEPQVLPPVARADFIVIDNTLCCSTTVIPPEQVKANDLRIDDPSTFRWGSFMLPWDEFEYDPWDIPVVKAEAEISNNELHITPFRGAGTHSSSLAGFQEYLYTQYDGTEVRGRVSILLKNEAPQITDDNLFKSGGGTITFINDVPQYALSGGDGLGYSFQSILSNDINAGSVNMTMSTNKFTDGLLIENTDNWVYTAPPAGYGTDILYYRLQNEAGSAFGTITVREP